MTNEPHPRLVFLDAVRGFTMLDMLCYHAHWDAVNLAGWSVPWHQENWDFYWQQSICCTFILLSGFCWSLGRSHKKHGLTVLCCGLLVSLVTLVVVPEQPVWFGILSFLGTASLLWIPLERLCRRVTPSVGLALSVMLFVLTRQVEYHKLGIVGVFTVAPAQWLYQGLPTAILGFHNNRFYSADYFPLIPWLFLFSAGYFVCQCLRPRLYDIPLLQWRCPPLEWLGRHSLAFYLVHQPLLMAVFTLAGWLVVSF